MEKSWKCFRDLKLGFSQRNFRSKNLPKFDSRETLWLATNCPCTSICRNDREEYTKNISLLRKLGYSLEDGAHYYFNTGNFGNYDDVVDTLVERLVEKPNFLDIGKKAK